MNHISRIGSQMYAMLMVYYCFSCVLCHGQFGSWAGIFWFLSIICRDFLLCRAIASKTGNLFEKYFHIFQELIYYL